MSQAVYPGFPPFSPAIPGLAYTVTKSPSWGTRMQRAVSGRTLRTGDWRNPIWNFTLIYSALEDFPSWQSGQTSVTSQPNALRILLDFFNSRNGAFDDFLFNDPTDNIAMGQLMIAAPGDTTGKLYQLTRALLQAGFTEWITAPRQVNAIYINGSQQSPAGYKVDASTGLVQFSSAPNGTVTADLTYWFRVYFPDSLNFEYFAYQLAELKQVKLTSIVQGLQSSFASTSQAGITTTLTVNPSSPTIPNNTPLGGLVATISVTNSDGSPFTGVIFFTAPKNDAGGVFSLSGNNVVVNPRGPGVSGITGTVTDFITLDATP